MLLSQLENAVIECQLLQDKQRYSEQPFLFSRHFSSRHLGELGPGSPIRSQHPDALKSTSCSRLPVSREVPPLSHVVPQGCHTGHLLSL
jgi:hypothetical protein